MGCAAVNPESPLHLEPARILGVEPLGLEEDVKSIMGDDPVHGWPHVVRVTKWAARIIREENLEADMDVLYAAIILHDIGRHREEEEGLHHAVIGGDVARKALTGTRLGDKIEEVVHAILAHSYSLGVEARSLEAMILSDADKLDCLGAAGITRTLLYGCQRKRSLEDSITHMEEKLLRLHCRFHFDYSRRKAGELVERVRLFLEWLRDEGITEASWTREL